MLALALRSQIEDSAGTNYESYVATLGSTRLVAPAYAIIGGPMTGQGIVLTITPNATSPLNSWRITDADGLPSSAAVADKFYVLQTNYDHWEEPPKIDDRETAAYDCMDNVIKKEGVSKETIYQLLAAMPNRNRLVSVIYIGFVI